MIPIVNHTLNEGDETFGVQLTTATGATLATPAQWLATILDDDPLQVSLSTSTTFPIAAATPIVWTASQRGGTAPYEYKFLLFIAGRCDS